ncbi:MAG: hypothetical protein WCP64_04035 [Actinomycetes bacterium]
MSNESIDPQIQREFEALGFNILGNEALADLVFEKVRRRRAKKWLVTGVVALILFLIAVLGYFIGSSSLFSSNVSIVRSNSYVMTAEKSGALSLPQFANIRVKANDTASHHISFTFYLKPGEMVEIFTQPKGNGAGSFGTLSVFAHQPTGSGAKIESYQIGQGSGHNEFGAIQNSGLFDFVYDFTDPLYEGSVVVGILLGAPPVN